VEGVGRLMSHCRSMRAFLHCSSGAVYEFPGHTPVKETDALGDNHRVMFPTYSISKIAAESMARFGARQWNIPTTIARLSVPYGDNGGWPWFHLLMVGGGHEIPVHPERPNVFNLLHEDDYIRQLPTLLEIAGVPALTVNWGGSEQVSVEEWCEYLGELTGRDVRFTETTETLRSLPLDLTLMHRHLGRTTVHWRDGIRRMVEARNPELLKA